MEATLSTQMLHFHVIDITWDMDLVQWFVNVQKTGVKIHRHVMQVMKITIFLFEKDAFFNVETNWILTCFKVCNIVYMNFYLNIQCKWLNWLTHFSSTEFQISRVSPHDLICLQNRGNRFLFLCTKFNTDRGWVFTFYSLLNKWSI